MPRVRKRTSNNRLSYTKDDLKGAVNLVLAEGWSERAAAKHRGIPRSTVKW